MNKLPNLADILTDTLSKLIEQSSTFVSNLISAVIIMVIGWAIAKGTSFILQKFLSKVGLDKLGEKIKNMELLRKYKLNFKLSYLISKVVYVLILLFLAIAAADTLGVPAISNMFLMLVNFIPKLIVAIVMTLLGVFISDLARKFIETLCKSFNISAGKLISMVVFFFLNFIVVILALGQAGINTNLLESSFNIIIAALALAFAIGYGIASKDILINILSSIYSAKKINEGDHVEIQGVKGLVSKIDNTIIELDTGDARVTFPLKVLQTEKIIIFNQ